MPISLEKTPGKFAEFSQSALAKAGYHISNVKMMLLLTHILVGYV